MTEACALIGFALIRQIKEESRARAVATLARARGRRSREESKANVDAYIEKHLWANCGQLVEEAAEGDYKECVRLLTERWADPNSMTDSRSALTAACRNGHSDVVSLLLEHRAQINKPSKSGATPLYAACSGSHYELASFLLERGADPSLALPSAVRDGAVDVARYLLEKGAVIDDNVAKQLTEGSFAPLDALLADPSATERRIL